MHRNAHVLVSVRHVRSGKSRIILLKIILEALHLLTFTKRSFHARLRSSIISEGNEIVAVSNNESSDLHRKRWLSIEDVAYPSFSVFFLFIFHCFFNPIQRFHKRRSLASHVDPLKTTSRLSEDRSSIQPNLCLIFYQFF